MDQNSRLSKEAKSQSLLLKIRHKKKKNVKDSLQTTVGFEWSAGKLV